MPGNVYKIIETGGCTLVFGSIPITDLTKLIRSTRKNPEVILSEELCSRSGASFAYGTQMAIETLLNSGMYPVSLKRSEERERTKISDLPIKIKDWLSTGDRGRSSEALCHLRFGVPIDAGIDHPLDVSDFRRCLQFLECYAETRYKQLEIIKSAAILSETWMKLAENWEELVTIYDSETESRKPKVSLRLKEILK